MPYFVSTPPRTISGNFVPASFPLPASSLPDPSNKVVLGGYSSTQTWRVPPFFGMGDAATDPAASPSLWKQVEDFVTKNPVMVAGGLLAILLLGGKRGR